MSALADITVLGLGLCGLEHITREAERAIGTAREVLYLDTGVATRDWLEARCPRVSSLYEQTYVQDHPRLGAYHVMAARVVAAALDHAPVVFAIQGHPLVFVHAPVLVRDLAAVLGLSVELLPGISAFDTLFADLWLDPCVYGLQVYEATDLLLRRRPLQPDVPALIWQVGNLETRLHTTRVSRPERFERFTRHLLQFYPGDHPVSAVYCSPHPLVPTERIELPLARLGEHAHLLHPGLTLYLPPTHVRPLQDAQLLELIDSAEHLRRITR